MVNPPIRPGSDGDALPAWFRDAKLGIFVHWGAYSVPAWAVPLGELGKVDPDEFFVSAPYAEWYANTIRIPGSPAARHHAQTYGDAPYDAFLDQWRAQRFDPAEWADLFAGIGARYVVLTTKHHDGICLWDAPGSGSRNTVHSGPRRDLVGELAGAARAAGLRFGTYYSGGLDWHWTDLPPITRQRHLSTHRPVDAGYAGYARGHLEDLIDRYAPDVLWNDIDWPDAGKDELPDVFRRYYREVPEGVVNDRWGVAWSDYLTSEYSEHPQNETTGRPWEHNRGIGYSFGYNQNETAEHYLSGPALVRHLVDVVVRGGNLLLNVGPRADGTIPDPQRRPLAELGAWLSGNGAAIFGTRPLEAPATPGCTGFTATGTDLYAHLDGAGPAVVLPLSRVDVGDEPAVELLGHGPVPARWTPDGLRCELPRPARDLPEAVRIARVSKGRHA
jgi:alpha-L-fucosidase